MSEDQTFQYNIIPTLRRFHEHPAQYRALVGPVGSGKTTGATWEICYYLPTFLFQQHGLRKTKWAVVRNTYRELRDTTFATITDWFSFGEEHKSENTYRIILPVFDRDGDPDGEIEVVLLLRACDTPAHVKQFKSLELTGFWLDESIEVPQSAKKMLKTRIGRYPRKSPVKFGIETTNPPDVYHPLYSEYKWLTPLPPGSPPPPDPPLRGHVGFWQPPYENIANLRKGYYDELREDFAGNKDWLDMYVMGMPGILQQGRPVYHNFNRAIHVATLEPGQIALRAPRDAELIIGWDNTGNTPAAVIGYTPEDRENSIVIIKEFVTERSGIVDFAKKVMAWVKKNYPFHPGIMHPADPAGSNKFSKPTGGFTSNAQLMEDECGIVVMPAEQNFTARTESVEQALGRVGGFLIDPGCSRLISGFSGGYHYPEIGNSGSYAEEPKKNIYSHPHDALQYICVTVLTTVMEQVRRKTRKRKQWKRKSFMGS